MTDLWLYDPKFCDGKPCVGDCDKCHVADEMDNEEEWEELRKEQRTE